MTLWIKRTTLVLEEWILAGVREEVPLSGNEAVSFLSTMIEMRNITVLSATFRHWKTLSGVLKELHFPSGNLFFDIRTAALMFEHGVSVIYTADADFFQFSELQVINPLSL